MPPQTATNGKMTRQQFAGWLKTQLPELSDYPDEQLIEGVLQRRPELRSRLADAEPEKPAQTETYLFGKEVARGMGFDPERIERYGGTSQAKQFLELANQFMKGGAGWMERVAKDPFKFVEPFEAVGGGIASGIGNVWKILTETDMNDPNYAAKLRDALGRLTGGLSMAAAGMERGGPIRDIANIPVKAAETTAEAARAAGHVPVRAGRAMLGAGEKSVERAAEAATKEGAEKFQGKLEKTRAGYRESLEKARREQIAKSRVEARQRSFSDLKDRISERFAENVGKAEKAERTQLDKRYDTFRKGLLGAKADLAPLAKAVESARNNILKGSKTSIPIFNDIIGNLKEVTEGAEGQLEAAPGKNLTDAAQLRGYVTELGEKMYSTDMPGDVYRALKSVREKAKGMVREMVEDTMGKQAATAYDQLNADWGDYENTWRDKSSGSPLVNILNTIRKPIAEKMGVPTHRQAGNLLTGRIGEQAIGVLARKRQFGADPNLAARVRWADRQLKSLPTAKELGVEQEAGGVTREEAGRPLAERPEYPKPPEAFDPVAFRRGKFVSAVERFKKFGWDDKTAVLGAMLETARGELLGAAVSAAYPILKRGVGALLDRPSIENWIAGGPLP